MRQEKSQTHDALIPPGVLQTVLENIVKHNQGSHEAPINSQILLKEHEIIVSNDLKPKNKPVDSTGIGLTNLKARYKLLTDQAVKIKSNGRFTITLPILKEVH